MEQIGDKIYRLRKEKGLSQEELGFEIGVSRQAISKWEANTMQPNLENIKSLCTIFNVNTDYFINDNYPTEKINQETAIASAKPITSNKNKKLFIILSVVLGIIIFVLVFAIVIVGHSVFTPNKGAFQVTSTNIQLPVFVILCVLFVATLIGEIVLLIKLLHRK